MQIGDETFIIAALLAMRHPRTIVLSGALSALVIMTVSICIDIKYNVHNLRTWHVLHIDHFVVLE